MADEKSPNEKKPSKKNAAAVALSKLGAAKGGRARASVMTDAQRKEVARIAAAARWKTERTGFEAKPTPDGESTMIGPQTAGDLPYSMFQGEIVIGDVKMPVHVLNDGRRVIAQREMVGVLAPGVDSGGLQRYVSNIPKGVETLDLVPNFVQFALRHRVGTMAAHVLLLPLRAPEIPGALPQAQQRRVDVQHDQADAGLRRALKAANCAAERGALQAGGAQPPRASVGDLRVGD